MKPPAFTAAALALDPLHLEQALQAAVDAGVAGLSLDLVDGTFAPGFGLSLDTVKALCARAPVPCQVHLRIDSPDRYTDAVAQCAPAGLTVPIEACPHAHRTVSHIRGLGLAAGVAVNPATPLTTLEYVLPLADRVHVLAREWGEPNGETPRAVFERVRILRENLDYRNSDAKLVVSGALDPRSAGELVSVGADIVVIDRPDVLRADNPAAAIQEFIKRATLAARTA